MWRQEIGGILGQLGGHSDRAGRFRGSKTRHQGQFSIAKTNRKRTLASCRLPPPFNLACQASSRLLWPLPCLAKNGTRAMTSRQISYPPSGGCAKTANLHCVLRFTGHRGSRAQQPLAAAAFLRAPRGHREASKTPTESLPAARNPSSPSPSRPARSSH